MNKRNTQAANPQLDGKWMTLQEASASTGFSLVTLRRYIKRGSLRFRRLGRSLNSKLEVYIMPNMPHNDCTPDQSTNETQIWFRTRVAEKDAKIEALMKELQRISNRNGYLESQLEKIRDQMNNQDRSKKRWWARFSSWFIGTKEKVAG